MNNYNYEPKPKHLDTDDANIQAITMVANQDWFQIIGCMVDETSSVDVNYTQLILWQIWNSSRQSVSVFNRNKQWYKDKSKETFIDQRQSRSGQEIAEVNSDYMVLQGKTWNALYDKYKAINEASEKLYIQLFDMHPKDRKIVKKSQGKMRTLNDLTPEEVQRVNQMNDQMFGY